MADAETPEWLKNDPHRVGVESGDWQTLLVAANLWVEHRRLGTPATSVMRIIQLCASEGTIVKATIPRGELRPLVAVWNDRQLSVPLRPCVQLTSKPLCHENTHFHVPQSLRMASAGGSRSVYLAGLMLAHQVGRSSLEPRAREVSRIPRVAPTQTRRLSL